MFGKGIYFADLVSKSANYCYAVNTEGFILLCEVALGEMQEEINAKSIAKPNKGKHSVKGSYFMLSSNVIIFFYVRPLIYVSVLRSKNNSELLMLCRAENAVLCSML